MDDEATRIMRVSEHHPERQGDELEQPTLATPCVGVPSMGNTHFGETGEALLLSEFSQAPRGGPPPQERSARFGARLPQIETPRSAKAPHGTTPTQRAFRGKSGRAQSTRRLTLTARNIATTSTLLLLALGILFHFVTQKKDPPAEEVFILSAPHQESSRSTTLPVKSSADPKATNTEPSRSDRREPSPPASDTKSAHAETTILRAENAKKTILNREETIARRAFFAVQNGECDGAALLYSELSEGERTQSGGSKKWEVFATNARRACLTQRRDPSRAAPEENAK